MLYCEKSSLRGVAPRPLYRLFYANKTCIFHLLQVCRVRPALRPASWLALWPRRLPLPSSIVKAHNMRKSRYAVKISMAIAFTTLDKFTMCLFRENVNMFSHEKIYIFIGVYVPPTVKHS